MAIIIFNTSGGGGCCLAVLNKVRGLIKRQIHTDTVDEQNAAAVFNRELFFVHQLVHKTVGLGLLARPPACGIHPGRYLVLGAPGFLHIQIDDAFLDGGQGLDVLLQFLGVVIAVSAHLDRMHHVGAVIGRHDLCAMAGDDGSGTGAQAVDLRRHLGRVLLQQIADCLGGEHITAAAVDAYRDGVQSAEVAKFVRKLFGRYLVAPPACLGNIAVKQQFHGASRLIAKLPKLICVGHFDSSYSVTGAGCAAWPLILFTSCIRATSIARCLMLRL